MSLAARARLGPYEVTAQIGVGGMGEVYRATDTKLKRDVAIKVLPESVAADPERLARFQREAEMLASLNHPNIAHIHGLEESDGTKALVMELVEGPTLADRIAQGPIPVDEALLIAKQVAEALEAAHEQGIVHRDLKPANIKVKSDGTVKVLDFGLAKAMEPASAQGASARQAQSMSPTITSPAMTHAGIILGTAAYMSPEQARGRPVDKRADIWAFGCVLYEMLAGTRAFDGEDATEIIAAVVKTTPNWAALPAGTPAPIVTLVQRCLEKDRQARIADLAVARFLLAEGPALSQAVNPGVAAAPTAELTGRRTTLLIVAALLAGAVASAVGTWWLMRPVAVPSRAERYVITTPPDAPAALTGNNSSVWISPDGSRIIYRTGVTSQRTPLWSRERDSLEPTVIPGTEGGYDVFFSPDGQWMGFFDSTDSTLKRLPTLGGSPQTICTVKAPGDTAGRPGAAYGRGASWGTDDQIVFATEDSKGIMRVPAAGGTPEVLTRVDPSQTETDYFWPEVLPDGSGVLFTAWNKTAERSRIAVVSRSDGRVSTLVEGGTYPRYAPGGHLLFALGGTLRAVRFDATRLAIAGSPVPVIEDVAMTPLGAAQYAIGGDGTLVYGKGLNGPPPVPPRTLVWVDRQGRQEPINAPPRAYTYARLSPDGTRIALDARDQQDDIWIWDLTRETLQRLTTDPGLDRSPVWTPDGTRVAFSSARDGKADGIFWQRADGSGQAERIDTGARDQSAKSFFPDGKRLVFHTPQTAPYDLGVLDFGAPPREQMLVQSAFNEANGELSPDGRWLAYESNESGRAEIYVRPFPEVATSKRLVSPGGGTRPLWSRDGRELFYYVEPGTIMALPVTLGSSFSFGRSVVAIEGPYARALNAGRHYDVSPDGKRFLLLKDVENASTAKVAPVLPEIRILLHFGDELERRLGKN